MDDLRACRLLFLTPQLGVGGLERQLVTLLKSIDRARYRPGVVVWNYDHRERYVAELAALDVPVVGLAGTSRWAKLRELRRLVAEVGPEVVHSYSFYANVAAAYACRRSPALAVGSLRSDFENDLAKSGPVLGRLSARFPASQIANSWRTADSVNRRTGPFVPRHLEVVPNGVDLATFSAAAGSGSGPVTVAGVGSLIGSKNWTVLLPLAARWHAEGAEVRVRIAGDGPERRALVDEVGRLGIGASVELVGLVDDVAAFLASADVLVHVSTREGMPNAVLEAMAAGLPVVAFDSGDVRRLVDDGVTGYVVPVGAVDRLDARLHEVFGDGELRRRMGRAGREKAEAFSSTNLAEGVLDAYSRFGWRDLSGEGRGAR